MPPSRATPELARPAPTAEFTDETVYSPWLETGLDARLRAREVGTLTVTAAETDVCVLAAILGGVDPAPGPCRPPAPCAAPATRRRTPPW